MRSSCPELERNVVGKGQDISMYARDWDQRTFVILHDRTEPVRFLVIYEKDMTPFSLTWQVLPGLLESSSLRRSLSPLPTVSDPPPPFTEPGILKIKRCRCRRKCHVTILGAVLERFSGVCKILGRRRKLCCK